MDEGTDFLQLLELQGNLEMVTKSELLEQVRGRGRSISERQLTTYMTEGLLPKSARIGSRGGAYPKIAIDQLDFVIRFRRRGISVNAIKELLPLWRYLFRTRRTQEISISEFEFLARQSITLPEAWWAVPGMLMDALPCPNCQQDKFAQIKVILKDGGVQSVNGDDPVSIGFVMATLDPDTNTATPHHPIRFALPRPDEGYNSSSVILGVPNGVQLRDQPCSDDTQSETRTADSPGGVEKGAE
jgi:DNA-binding transcriptional MerR regulator